MRYALPCSILACAALSGCANPTGELEARMIELEFRMNTLEARLDVLAPYADRVEALETALREVTEEIGSTLMTARLTLRRARKKSNVPMPC